MSTPSTSPEATSAAHGGKSFTCCNDHQFRLLFLIICYAVLIFKLWEQEILHPFKILTVFLHELGHAMACWLTGGTVKSMEVNPDEGGATRTVGGISWIILSAGYLGSAAWGMGFVVASAEELSSEIATAVLIVFLFVFVFYAQNEYLKHLNLGFVVALSALLLVNIFTVYNPVEYVLLFVGVMNCLFAIYDIWDDLISRDVDVSDATVFAQHTHMSSKFWGIVWGLLALISLAAAVYFNLTVGVRDGTPISVLDTTLTTKLIVVGTIILCLVSANHTRRTGRWIARPRRYWTNYSTFLTIDDEEHA